MVDPKLNLEPVLTAYGIDPALASVEKISGGLINITWKVRSQNKQFVLQRVNKNVFNDPWAIVNNKHLIGNYLAQHHPNYLFVGEIPTEANQLIFENEQGYFRLSTFVKDSHTISVVQTPEQAFEAAYQFGKFSKVLKDFDAMKLVLAIPDFHNLTLRYRQFETACVSGNNERITACQDVIKDVKRFYYLVEKYEAIRSNPNFKIRVMHHDTKISNVLFNPQDRSLCVIDLDTVMPGYFISDVGDMMRTYLSPANEEESDFEKIEVRLDFFKAIAQGYLKALGSEMTKDEIDSFTYSGLFMVYMQAIRFITDHLNNDQYYEARYEGHNLVRGQNQLKLLNEIVQKEEVLRQIVKEESSKIRF